MCIGSGPTSLNASIDLFFGYALLEGERNLRSFESSNKGAELVSSESDLYPQAGVLCMRVVRLSVILHQQPRLRVPGHNSVGCLHSHDSSLSSLSTSIRVCPAYLGSITEQRCAEQLLPGPAPWPAVPHRGLRIRRCRAGRTIGDITCVVADGVVFSRASLSRPTGMVVLN